MKNQSVLLAKETEDGYISLGTITLMPDRSNDADRNKKKSNGKVDAMKEQFVKLVTWIGEDDILPEGSYESWIARVYGKELTIETINRVKDAILDYKVETEGEWNDDGCLDAAQGQLEKEGYKVEWIQADEEIIF